MIKYFNIPHSGDWFSETTHTDYVEALVSKDLKPIYKKNELYPLQGLNGEIKNIKIIGYLGDDNLTINLMINQFSSFFAAHDIMICDELTLEEIANNSWNKSIFITEQHNIEYFENKFEAKAQTMEKAYKLYREDIFPLTYFISVLGGILFV